MPERFVARGETGALSRSRALRGRCRRRCGLWCRPSAGLDDGQWVGDPAGAQRRDPATSSSSARWHLSGQDEMLGVILERTEAGRDPIWLTPLVERLPPSAYVPAQGESRNLPDGTPVTVLPYGVAFVGDRWVADVELPGLAAASYRPFVRLAVARYHRESFPELELSAVVLTDLVQLLPERTLSVDTSAAALRVRVDGLGPLGPTRTESISSSRRVPAATSIDVSRPARFLGRHRRLGGARDRVHEVGSGDRADTTGRVPRDVAHSCP